MAGLSLACIDADVGGHHGTGVQHVLHRMQNTGVPAMRAPRNLGHAHGHNVDESRDQVDSRVPDAIVAASHAVSHARGGGVYTGAWSNGTVAIKAFDPRIAERWDSDPGDLLPPFRTLDYMCADAGSSWWDGLAAGLALRPCKRLLQSQQFQLKTLKLGTTQGTATNHGTQTWVMIRYRPDNHCLSTAREPPADAEDVSARHVQLAVSCAPISVGHDTTCNHAASSIVIAVNLRLDPKQTNSQSSGRVTRTLLGISDRGTERHTARQRDGEAETCTHIERERERDTHTHTKRYTERGQGASCLRFKL